MDSPIQKPQDMFYTIISEKIIIVDNFQATDPIFYNGAFILDFGKF